MTREPVPGTLRDRATKLLFGLLVDRGFRVLRRGNPGLLAVENHW